MMNQTKKHTTSKKLLALLLALIMTVSLLPMSVFAAAVDVPETEPQVTEPVEEDMQEPEVTDVDTQAADGVAVQADTAFNYVTKNTEAGVSLKNDKNFYRIFLLDCGRKYFSVSEIEGIIDQLAENHYTHIQLAFGNDGLRFLLDDMSLTVNGTTYTTSQVTSAIQTGNDNFDRGASYSPGSKEELTQDEMNAIIKYASEKGIGVIPMFDAPGHMYTVVTAMKSLMSTTENVDYVTENFGYAGKAANWKIIPTSATAVNFVQALMQKYITYFAGKGCTMFNIAADESSITSDATYTAYVDLVNSLAAMVQNAGMAALAFNDGINKTSYTSERSFDTNIAVCYWTEGEASVADLSKAGFTIINNTNDWYYVLGDFLKESWGSSQWGYSSALAGIKSTPVTQAKGAADGAIELAGSVLCCWCDGPKKDFSSSKSNVYTLIQTMAAQNPDYFKAEETPAEPELVVDTDASTVQPKKQEDGSYTVAVKADETLQLKVTNYEGSLTWTSNNADVATVKDGVVTFTGVAGNVTITAKPALATRGDDTVFTATFAVTPRIGGDLTDVPDYTEGEVTGDNSVKYVLDTDGVDAGETYLIVASNTGKALSYTTSYGSTTIGSTDVTTKSDSTATISNTTNALWTISNGVIASTDNSSYKLYYNNGLSVSNRSTTTWTIGHNGNGQYQISYTSTGIWSTTNYIGYNYSYWSSSYIFGTSTKSNTVRLYKQVQGGYKVDTTNLKALIDTAAKLDPDAFVNWGDVNMDTVLEAANAALADVKESYTDQRAATTAQNSVNSAAQNLYNALSQLRYRSKKTITVNCVDEAGAAIGNGSYVFYAYENGNGGYDYKFSAPPIDGYKCSRGTVISGTVTEDTTLTLTYIKGSFSLPDSVEIPITIVDYRADGLLFDYSIDSGETSIAYQLVQTAHGSGTTTAQSAISGTTLTSLTPQDNAAGRGTNWATNGNGSYIRTGMVKEDLGANGMPVYTDATVQYVAAALSAGKCRTSHQANWNDILYNTFLASDAPRPVRNSGTSGFSKAFQNSKTYDNITNAYDLAWYLLNTLYIGDTNMATVVDQTDTTKSYQLPIYGMADSTYNKLILVKDDTDGSYYMKAYTDGAKIKYDEANGAIYNSSADNSNNSRFLYPLCGKGYDAYLGDTTDNQLGAVADENYPAQPNGNYTLRGESQFVYYADQNQYFEFTGDDDVYLFINNKLVLDLGGAHWSLMKRVNMNDIATKCGLKNGEVATFTFFYMERFSDCSNFGIRTNMGLVERGIDAAKKAYGSDAYLRETPSGSVIEDGTSQYYDLTLTNKGNQVMTNIKFVDTDNFNASVSFGYGVASPSFTPVTGKAFALADSGKYALFITDGSGSVVENSQKTFTTLDELSTTVAGISLPAGQTLHVRFLTVTANVPVATMAGYTNTLTVEAVSGGQTLRDSAIHQLYSYNISDTAKNYVVDFGLPLEITNIFDASAESYIVDEKLTLSSTLQYGTLDINGTGYGTTLTYTLKDKATIDGVEKIILKVKYSLGGTSVTLDKTIHIIPASTVYYEDDFAKFTNADNTTVVTTGTADNGFWQTVGTKDTNAKQALDKLGDPNANVYGYDPAYNSCTTYSLGSATKVTVDKSTKDLGGWPYATFTFKGTGFDIISLTDNTSGAIYVDIYKGDKVDETQRLKGYVVNNYYGYTYENGQWMIKDNVPNATYQVPVIKSSDLTYDQYTVKIMVGYSQYQDVANAGNYSFWLDAIRVYNPGGSALDNAYNLDGEKNPNFVQLRKVLLDANSFNADTLKNGAVFIDGMGKTAVVDDYKNYGPNHEVYLANGQAIAFQLVANGVPAGLQLGAKLANGDSGTLAITGASFVKGDAEGKLNLATATDMFYELNGITWTEQGDGTYKSGAITLTNNGTGMISLTNLKLINAKYTEDASAVTNAASDEVLVTMVMDADIAQEAVAAVDSVLHPQEVKTFAPERFEASWNRSSVKAGEKATLTVKTSEDVEAITVDGVTIDTYRTRTQRTGWGWNAKKVTYREFTYTITASETADHEIVAVNAEGTASEAITATLTVRAAAQRPGIGGWLNKLFSRWF